MKKNNKINANILIVEDEKTSSTMLKQLLKKCDCHVSGIVETGEDAIKQAQVLKPDLILMDITLGGEIDGIDAAGQILEKNNIPCIYLTEATDSSTLERAKKTMPLGYIIKPLNLNMLQTTIEMALYRFDIDKKLREIENRNKEILENIPDILFQLNLDGTFADNADADSARKIWPEKIAKKAVPYMKKAYEGGKIQIFEYAFKKAQSIRYFEARFIPRENNSILVIARDVSVSKKAELELIEYKSTLENRVNNRTEELKVFRHTINQSPNGIIILDKSGIVEYVNLKYLTLSGYDYDELIGISVNSYPNPVISEPEIWESMSSIDHWRGEVYNVNKKGEIYYGLSSVTSIKGDNNEITHYVISVEDITDKKREMLEIDKVKNILDRSKIDMMNLEQDWQDWKEKIMSRNISRTDKSLFKNINNSFTQGAGFGALISLLDMLASTAEKSNGKHLVDSNIFELTLKNVHIAQDAFKTFANIDWIISNDFEMEKASFNDLYDFIRAVIKKTDDFSKIKKQKIVISDFMDEYSNISTNLNREYLYKALYEGLINALKFSKASSNILVLIYILNNNIAISVINDPEKSDEGVIGIPSEYSKVIFEPFYRMTKFVFEQYSTLDFGLGLTLVEKIVGKHGGNVSVENIYDHTDLKREPQTKVNLTITLPIMFDS